MDGEVVHSLLGLLDEGVAVELPGEVFDASVYFFEGLIDGHGADGDRGVADDPFAGGVDVFPGGKIHHGVGSPRGGPTHFLHFFVDGGGHGGVADVGVDFDEEVTADGHGLVLGVIDVDRNDGASAGDFTADEFGSDEVGETGSEGLAGMLVVHAIACHLGLRIDFGGTRHVVTVGGAGGVVEFRFGFGELFLQLGNFFFQAAGLGEGR